ncbi:uncharacterized protein N0V89_010212 [Didymosphaeria variabile]|uniref:ABM domain-containing protein n=1 Tax=Didymosphaeria variabile TaxID=1932322 RepID=A0A9W8XGL9_9PLEO|nr:uncharacterized protein N0V89_010212 [Didymosphaeria variabile]KAJ4348834.1 hypothetical protein N0V89_010212 [Didymosphaeria variabile]
MRNLALLLATAVTSLAATVTVTEVANLTLAANASTEVFDKAAKVFLAQPGAVKFRSSRLVENSDSFRLFVDWETIEASHAFAKTKAYKHLQKEIQHVLAKDPVYYHVAFEPSPPVVFDNYEGKGESPFTEFLNFFFPGGDGYNSTREANVTETMTAILEKYAPTADGFTGHTALGWGLDEIAYMGAQRRVFAIGVGWESVEAHETWEKTPAYAEFLPQLLGLDSLIGIEMRHVSNKIVKKAEA